MNKAVLCTFIFILLLSIYFYYSNNQSITTEYFRNNIKKVYSQCDNINLFKMKKNIKEIDLLQDSLDSFAIDLDKTKLKVDKNYKQFKKSMKGAKTATNQLNNF